jgi:subtilisin family serine protease
MPTYLKPLFRSSLLIILLMTMPLSSFAATKPSMKLQVFDVIEMEKSEEPTDIIVKFKDEKQIDEILEETKVSSIEVLEEDVLLVEPTGTSTMESAIEELENDPNVEYAEPNYSREITVIATNDTFKDLMWAIYNNGQVVNNVSGVADADMDINEAWAISEGDDSIIVAVIDSGVDYEHPDIEGSMWDGSNCKDENGVMVIGGCIHGYDYASNDADPMTTHFHGTHVAGTIAASKNNSAGTIGVAPQTKIMALRFSLDVASEVKAINFARENGAKVINASFSGTGYSSAEYNAIQAFQNAGGIFVAAASNEGSDNDGTPYYPASYDLPGIISVAATDQFDALASFSNYGDDSVDVGAPGVNIASLVPDSLYGYSSGTSMASPHVAGLVSLIWATYPDLSAAEVKAIIMNTGDELESLEGKTVSEKRVNAYNAVTALTPRIGYSENDLIPSNAISVSSDGQGIVTFNFYVRAGLSGISATTSEVEYSIDDGSTWTEASVGSDFVFNEEEFETVTEYAGTPYQVVWNTKLTASTSATSTALAKIRFKVETDATSSPYVYSSTFAFDNITPIVIASTSGGGSSSGGSSGSSGGGGGSSKSKKVKEKVKEPAKKPVIVASASETPPDIGCLQGYLFSITTGKRCVEVSVPVTENPVRTFPITPTSPLPIFTRDLSLGAVGEDVRQLQIYLNTHGYPVAVIGVGSAGQEGTMFGGLTQAALIRFQIANGIVPASGYLGPITKAAIK